LAGKLGWMNKFVSYTTFILFVLKEDEEEEERDKI